MGMSVMDVVLRSHMEALGYCWACEDAEIDGQPHTGCTGPEGYVCECHCREEES
jgi:hypothetical protein